MLNFLNFVITNGLPQKVMTNFPLVISRYSGRFITLVKSPSKSDFITFKKCFWFVNPYITILKGQGKQNKGREGDEATFLTFFFFNPHLRICVFLGWREGGRERNINHAHPDQGLNPQPRYIPWLEIEPATFQYTGQCYNQLSHLARATFLIVYS